MYDIFHDKLFAHTRRFICCAFAQEYNYFVILFRRNYKSDEILNSCDSTSIEGDNVEGDLKIQNKICSDNWTGEETYIVNELPENINGNVVYEIIGFKTAKERVAALRDGKKWKKIVLRNGKDINVLDTQTGKAHTNAPTPNARSKFSMGLLTQLIGKKVPSVLWYVKDAGKQPHSFLVLREHT